MAIDRNKYVNAKYHRCEKDYAPGQRCWNVKPSKALEPRLSHIPLLLYTAKCILPGHKVDLHRTRDWPDFARGGQVEANQPALPTLSPHTLTLVRAMGCVVLDKKIRRCCIPLAQAVCGENRTTAIRRGLEEIISFGEQVHDNTWTQEMAGSAGCWEEIGNGCQAEEFATMPVPVSIGIALTYRNEAACPLSEGILAIGRSGTGPGRD